MKKSILKKYANLIACTGINVQKGQEVWITCSLDQPEFIRMLALECYKLGASFVKIDWKYQDAERDRLNKMSLKNLSKICSYKEEELKYQADVVPCRIRIESDDPDGFTNVDFEKVAKARQNQYPTIKKYRDMWENKDQWCIAGVPGEKWAKKVFPNLKKNQAVEKLWQAILETARVDDNPVLAWKNHNEELHKRCSFLNSLGIESLHYKNSLGTDLNVGLISSGRFCAGREKSLQGIEFNPNIPSEECFTSPMKGQADGIVYASKPLCYEGQLIENFWIRFENGKASSWHAEKNNELLSKMINMDEGSAYLGECALVPFDSPINNTEILFYNTLYDENAVCHLALGTGFPDCIEGFENISLENVHKMGVNESMIHEDFMIGTKDLSITAKCRDGRIVEIFRDGNWAFEV